MNFTIDGSGGAMAAGQGLGNMFKAAAMAPMYRQQAEADSALKGAQLYHHTMAGNKAGVEAEQKRGALSIQNDPLENTMLSLGLPTNLAPAFRNKLATGDFGGAYTAPADGVGPVMPAPADADTVKKLAQAMSLTQRMFATGSNVHQGAQAALEEQKARGIDAMVANPALAGNYGKANAAAAGKPLFDNVGNTGYSIDSFTGGQAEANPVLAKIFSAVENSKANENNAQAGNANAQKRKHTLEGDALAGAADNGGSGKPLTNSQLRANEDVEAARKYVTDLPRETVAGVLRKNEMDMTPQDKDILARIRKSRTAKFGEKGVPDQYNDMLGLDQSVVQQLAGALANPGTNQAGVLSKLFGGTDQPMTEEEVIKGVLSKLSAAEQPNQAQYIAAAKQKNRSSAPAPAGDKNPAGGGDTPKIEAKVPAGYKQIGTSNGKPVYQGPDGKKYVME